MIPNVSPPARAEHEFDEDDGEHFRELVGAMRFVSGGSIALGAMLVVVIAVLATRFTLGFVAPIAAILVINAACLAVIGVLHRSAALALSRVYDTEGSDVTHLMDGLARLRGLYRFLAVLLIVVLVVGVVIPTGLLLVAAALALGHA